MKDVVFICAQPAIPYYTWQVEVMINNFETQGVNLENVHIVSSYTHEIPDQWKKLQQTYTKVKFFFYKDERFKPNYIPSIRPHILHKHWLHNPELENSTVFYHDCDIILAKPYDFSEMLKDDVTCYVSDTVSYIGAKYVRSKGEHYLDLMTGIVGVNKQYVIEQEENSGGAQYLLKNIPAKFWEKVYYDCEIMYRMVNDQIAKDKPPHAIQIWCADMWCVLWNLFIYDRPVKVTDHLSFSWATSGMHDWDKHPIFHNAGVTGPGKQFYKGAYINKLPYGEIDLEKLSKDFCSYKYAEEIVNTKQITCLK